jgi:hypothetical protein
MQLPPIDQRLADASAHAAQTQPAAHGAESDVDRSRDRLPFDPLGQQDVANTGDTPVSEINDLGIEDVAAEQELVGGEQRRNRFDRMRQCDLRSEADRGAVERSDVGPVHHDRLVGRSHDQATHRRIRVLQADHEVTDRSDRLTPSRTHGPSNPFAEAGHDHESSARVDRGGVPRDQVARAPPAGRDTVAVTIPSLHAVVVGRPECRRTWSMALFSASVYATNRSIPARTARGTRPAKSAVAAP